MPVRFASAADAAAARSIYAPYVQASAVSFELVVPPVEEMAERITARQPAYPFLVDDAGGTILGYAYAGRFSARAAYDWTVEVSVYVDAAAQRRGVGRRLSEALLALLTLQGYRMAIAIIAVPHPASVGLHEALGFTPVGTVHDAGWKLGSWHDVGWWQRPLGGPPSHPPGPIVPLDQLDAGASAAALGEV